MIIVFWASAQMLEDVGFRLRLAHFRESASSLSKMRPKRKTGSENASQARMAMSLIGIDLT